MAKKLMNEQKFNKLIYKLVKESLDTFMQSSPMEADNSSDNNSEEGETEKERKIRMSVEKQLQRPGIDIAPYAYKLEDLPIQTSNGDDNDHKNARSKLYKKINHKPDSNGEPQYLSPEEAIELKNELSSNLSENRKLKLSESDIMYMVNESVKKLLNELDWKTYANAARKRALQGDPKHTVKDLDSAANRELEKLYSIPKDNPYYNYKSSPELKTTSYHTFSNPTDSHVAKQEIKFPNHEHPMFQDYYESVTNNDEDFPFHDTDINLYDSPTDPIDRKSRPDLTNYISGKSKYIKGKGWQ